MIFYRRTLGVSIHAGAESQFITAHTDAYLIEIEADEGPGRLPE